MIIERLFPGTPESIDLDADVSRQRLLDWYRPPRADWLRLNLITSVTGAASGSDGTSETLTNAADRRILGVIRELSDVVLVGAQSVRSEGYQQPKRARIAILTSSGDLSGNRIERGDAAPPIVLCPASAATRALDSLPAAEIIELETHDGHADVLLVIDALRQKGLASIVCEGGPSLVSQLVEAGLVDEFCLSTSARIGGAAFPVLGTETIGERRVELAQLIKDEASGLYARWLLAG